MLPSRSQCDAEIAEGISARNPAADPKVIDYRLENFVRIYGRVEFRGDCGNPKKNPIPLPGNRMGT